jgi:putative ABC transport system permease protein
MFMQSITLTLLGLRSLRERRSSAGIIVVGIAGVVGVLVSVLAMAAGFQHTLAANGRDDRVIVLRAGSDTEIGSTLTRADLDGFANLGGIARDAAGKPVASYDVVTVVNLPHADSADGRNVTLRGVSPSFAAVRPEMRVVEGRMFRPAVRELIVGTDAAEQFGAMVVGHVLHLRNADWTVVGRFTTGGDVHESELIADADTVAAAIGRPGYSSGVLRLAPGVAPDALHVAAAAQNLKVDVHRESDYLRAQSGGMATALNVVGRLVGVIMAIGAMFAALNSMYAAVADRRREIATLRTIGFNPGAVLTAVMVEALLLSIVGGAIGAGIAWLAFDGHRVSTMGGNFSQVVFPLEVNGALLLTGLTWACFIGLIGGFFPALHAARQNITDGLRVS